jgi:hypothetical protein
MNRRRARRPGAAGCSPRSAIAPVVVGHNLFFDASRAVPRCALPPTRAPRPQPDNETRPRPLPPDRPLRTCRLIDLRGCPAATISDFRPGGIATAIAQHRDGTAAVAAPSKSSPTRRGRRHLSGRRHDPLHPVSSGDDRGSATVAAIAFMLSLTGGALGSPGTSTAPSTPPATRRHRAQPPAGDKRSTPPACAPPPHQPDQAPLLAIDAAALFAANETTGRGSA